MPTSWCVSPMVTKELQGEINSMNVKAKRVLDELLGRTNINNINNNINYTNNTSTFVSEESKPKEMTSSFPLAPASPQSLEEALASSGSLPANWRGVKLDLFGNHIDCHKLKLGIIRHDGTTLSLVAALNSPRRSAYRGRDTQGTPRHWQLLEAAELAAQAWQPKVSKIGKMRKAGTLRDFACVVYKQTHWHVELVYEQRIWPFVLTGTVSDAFRSKGGIATVYQGQQRTTEWQDPKELGI